MSQVRVATPIRVPQRESTPWAVSAGVPAPAVLFLVSTGPPAVASPATDGRVPEFPHDGRRLPAFPRR